MTIELTEDEMLEVVKALEAVRRQSASRDLSVEKLTTIINHLRLHLPGSGLFLRPKPKDTEQK